MNDKSPPSQVQQENVEDVNKAQVCTIKHCVSGREGRKLMRFSSSKLQVPSVKPANEPAGFIHPKPNPTAVCFTVWLE